jgi:hypothetical protein
MIPYILNRSKRRTIAIYIRGGAVEVRAPLRTSVREIEQFLLSKQDWILKNLSESKTELQRKDSFVLNYGDMVLYCGKQYKITPSASGKIGVSNDCFYIPANLQTEQIKSACVRIYRILAKSDLTVKVYDYAKKMSVIPNAVKINGANTRWGSCSAKRSLNFSWRLIMADDEVIDYVVVHELAHIIEMNHSARFWAVVERIIPDYRRRKKKLKELQKKLNAENWDGA